MPAAGRRLEVHLGVYGMTEALHRELQPLRRNVFEVTACLREAGVFFVAQSPAAFLPRPGAARRLPAAARRSAGARGSQRHDGAGAQRPRRADRRRTAGTVRHRLALIGGSDAHTLRRVGRTWTEAPGSATRDEFLDSLRAGLGRPGGAHGGAGAVAGDAYGVVARYSRQPDRVRATRPAPLRRAALHRRSRSCSLPAQFVPLAIVAARQAARGASGRAGARGALVMVRARRRRWTAAAGAARMSRRASPSPASGSSPRSARPASETWQRPRRRPLRHRARHAVRRRRAIAAGSRPKCDLDAVDAPLTPLERRRWSRGDSSASPPRARRSRTRACSTSAIDRVADRRLARCRHRRSPPQRRRSIDTMLDARDSQRARPSDAWNHFSSTRSTSSPRGSASKASLAASSPPVRRARSRSARPRTRSARPARRRARRRHRRARAPDFQRVQRAEADGSGAVPTFDRSRAGMNIGEGAAMLVLEEMDRARKRAARRSTASSPATSFGCEAFHPTAPEPEGKPVAAVIAAALRDAGLDATTSITSTRTAPRRRRTTAPRARGFRRGLRRARRAAAGHVDQVDDRPLPRRGRRDRGRRRWR